MIIFQVAVLLLLLSGFFLLIHETYSPVLTAVDIENPRKQKGQVEDEPITILHISDLHGRSFGKEQQRIRRLISGKKVDLIALTGDLVDEKTREIQPVKGLLACLPDARTFFVPGNHDKISPVYRQLYRVLHEHGVEILENQKKELSIRSKTVHVVGLDDPHLGSPDPNLLRNSGAEPGEPSLLLCHSPTLGRKGTLAFKAPSEQNAATEGGGKKSINCVSTTSILDISQQCGFDLVLAGHTHGGQVKLPLVGAVFVPGQSFPPKYVEGLYKKENTQMFITRGLGTSRLPVRFLSRPEICLIRWFP